MSSGRPQLHRLSPDDRRDIAVGVKPACRNRPRADTTSGVASFGPHKLDHLPLVGQRNFNTKYGLNRLTRKLWPMGELPLRFIHQIVHSRARGRARQKRFLSAQLRPEPQRWGQVSPSGSSALGNINRRLTGLWRLCRAWWRQPQDHANRTRSSQCKPRYVGENRTRRSVLQMVGAERFELPTLCSQNRCATRLRYAPDRGCL